jgi:hypothetical protein
MESWTGRTIAYGPAFEQEIERLGINYQRLDEALTGIEWAMSNKPDAFPQVYGSKLRMAKTRRVPHVPALRVWFTLFDDNTVTIVFAEPSQDDED